MTAPSALTAEPAVPPQRRSPVTRLATPADDRFVEALQALAFGPGRFARTAFRVRERFPIDKSLSLIAEIAGVPVSSVWMTPISVGGINGYLLGPLATDPAYRGVLLVTPERLLPIARAAAQSGLQFTAHPVHSPSVHCVHASSQIIERTSPYRPGRHPTRTP